MFILDRKARTLNGVAIDGLKYQGKSIENVYDYIDGVWLLTSGAELSGEPDFEIRALNNESIIEYYISVK